MWEILSAIPSPQNQESVYPCSSSIVCSPWCRAPLSCAVSAWRGPHLWGPSQLKGSESKDRFRFESWTRDSCLPLGVTGPGLQLIIFFFPSFLI